MSAEYFEELYRADPDPWDLAGSAYERDKYAATIAALPPGPVGSALEVGCSIGVLSALLAERCGALWAIDSAPRAVAQARRRLEGLGHVRVEERRAPDEMPEGPFDLVVCSEVLYYGDRSLLEETWSAVLDAVAPGGSVLAVHWRGPMRHYPLSGEDVHAHLATGHAGFAHALSERRPQYLLDRFDRAGAPG
jgi:protein-L-isoaspartate O-methyltransferase